MSADWKLTLPCTRAEAEALGEDFEDFAMLDPVPSIVTQEVEAFNDLKWELLAYFPQKPPAKTVQKIQEMIPSARKAAAKLERLPDTDWLVESQQGLEPVHAGRFYAHTEATRSSIPDGVIPLHIEAGQAFGTGGHETTSGCLAMLDRMKRQGQRYDNIADIGTGTGLLAFAALHLWPRAYITASDIDPVAIDVTISNADANAVPLGSGQGKVALCVAAGTDHEMIQRRAPYDLVIANILAGPLVELASSFAEIIAEGGTLILAGLLDTQASAVTTAYRAAGFRLQERSDTSDWPCLRMIKRKSYGWKRPLRAHRRTSQPSGDFGTW